MKKVLLFCLIIVSELLQGQNPVSKLSYDQKVSSIDSTITTLYSVISGDQGEKRNWELFKFLFRKNARLIPSGENKDGDVVARYISADTYVETSGKWLVENGFHEVEIHRIVEQFGHIAHVFSTYESYRNKSDEEPFMRGINSIQLLNDGKRWWIVNVYWMQESDDYPIPEAYLPTKS